MSACRPVVSDAAATANREMRADAREGERQGGSVSF